MDIQGRIDAARKALRLNHQEMAKELGLSRSMYYNVKSGENPIGNSAFRELERLELLAVRKTESESRIMEAAEYANQYTTERERQIAFEKQLASSQVDVFRERALKAEAQLAEIKAQLLQLLDSL